MITRRRMLAAALTAAAASPALAPRAWASAPSDAASSDFDFARYVEDVENLVAIDSKSGHEPGADAIAQMLAEKFRAIGWTVETPRCEGRGLALVATNGPDAGADAFDVILCGHSDTVQPVGSAAAHPFRMEGTIARGAGAGDAKSSLAMLWWICKALPESVLKTLRLAVVVNPGEESGSPASSAFMAAMAKKAPVALIYEPGRGEVPGGAFVKARKGCIFLKVEFEGVPAHAGNNPEKGRNAVYAMALAIPEISAVAKKHPGATLNADVVSGGTTPNTIAAHAEAVFDFRFFDDKTRDAVLGEVRALCRRGFLEGVTATMIEPGASSAMAETERTKALERLVELAAADLGQPKPKWLAVGGASDGNRFSGAGAAVVCAMGAVSGDLHHPEKEWTDLSTAAPRIALSRRMLERLAEEKTKGSALFARAS